MDAFIYLKRKEMYKDYCKELDAYDEGGIIYPDSQADYVANCYIHNPKVTWVDVFDEKEVVGFLIFVGGKKEIRIIEAYVIPGKRHLGFMTAVLDKSGILGSDQIVLEIFRKNILAAGFWKRYMQKRGFKLVYKGLITEDGLRKHIYTKPER